jgi:hypothetical protein
MLIQEVKIKNYFNIFFLKKLHHKVGHTVALTEFCVHQVINAQDD